MSKNGDEVCNHHMALALDCGKIDAILDNVVASRVELKEGMKMAFAMESRITVLETKNRERWGVQKWWNITFAGGMLGILAAMWLEWMKFHG